MLLDDDDVVDVIDDDTDEDDIDDDVVAGSFPDKVLPNTGGLPVFGLVAGCILAGASILGLGDRDQPAA